MKALTTTLIMFSVWSAVAQQAPEETASDKTADTITAAAQRLELDTTSVTGNRELPKVLVIVPWKSPASVELTGRPLASLVEEVLSPIDPDVFRRQVNYYNALQQAADETATANSSKKSDP